MPSSILLNLYRQNCSLLVDELPAVLYKDTLSVHAYALTCEVVNRSVLVKNIYSRIVDASCSIQRMDIISRSELISSIKVYKLTANNNCITNLYLICRSKLLFVKIISTIYYKLSCCCSIIRNSIFCIAVLPCINILYF